MGYIFLLKLLMHVHTHVDFKINDINHTRNTQNKNMLQMPKFHYFNFLSPEQELLNQN